MTLARETPRICSRILRPMHHVMFRNNFTFHSLQLRITQHRRGDRSPVCFSGTFLRPCTVIDHLPRLLCLVAGSSAWRHLRSNSLQMLVRLRSVLHCRFAQKDGSLCTYISAACPSGCLLRTFHFIFWSALFTKSAVFHTYRTSGVTSDHVTDRNDQINMPVRFTPPLG